MREDTIGVHKHRKPAMSIVLFGTVRNRQHRPLRGPEDYELYGGGAEVRMPDWAKLYLKVGLPLADALPVAPLKRMQPRPKHGEAEHAAGVHTTAVEGNKEPFDAPQLVP